MANNNDSAIVSKIASLPTTQMLAGLLQWSSYIQDDAAYWCVLGVCWVQAGEHANIIHWATLLASERPRRWKIMKTSDRQAWRALPGHVVAFRAIAYGEDPECSVAWSLDSAVCRRLWPEREIVRRVFPKDRVEALFRRRGESEVLIRPPEGWAEFAKRPDIIMRFCKAANIMAREFRPEKPA